MLDSGPKSEPDSESNSGCEWGPASVCVARSSPRDIQNRGRQHERSIFLSNESSASPLPEIRTGYRTGWSPSLGQWEGGFFRSRLMRLLVRLEFLGGFSFLRSRSPYPQAFAAFVRTPPSTHTPHTTPPPLGRLSLRRFTVLGPLNSY